MSNTTVFVLFFFELQCYNFFVILVHSFYKLTSSMAMHGLIKDFMQKKIILQILSKFSSLETLLEVHLDWIVEIQTYIESLDIIMVSDVYILSY